MNFSLWSNMGQLSSPQAILISPIAYDGNALRVEGMAEVPDGILLDLYWLSLP